MAEQQYGECPGSVCIAGSIMFSLRLPKICHTECVDIVQCAHSIFRLSWPLVKEWEGRCSSECVVVPVNDLQIKGYARVRDDDPLNLRSKPPCLIVATFQHKPKFRMYIHSESLDEFSNITPVFSRCERQQFHNDNGYLIEIKAASEIVKRHVFRWIIILFSGEKGFLFDDAQRTAQQFACSRIHLFHSANEGALHVRDTSLT